MTKLGEKTTSSAENAEGNDAKGVRRLGEALTSAVKAIGKLIQPESNTTYFFKNLFLLSKLRREILVDSIFTDLSSWRNGIRDIVVFQLSDYDQRNGIRVCTPFYQVKIVLSNQISYVLSTLKPITMATKKESTQKSSDKESNDPCWDGYKKEGMKTKSGKKVPNCVPDKQFH